MRLPGINFLITRTNGPPHTLLDAHNVTQRHTSEHLDFVERVVIALFFR